MLDENKKHFLDHKYYKIMLNITNDVKFYAIIKYDMKILHNILN